MPVTSWEHAGPDDPIYKGGLRVSSVLGPSALTKNSPKSTDGEKQSSAPSDPMLPAMNGMEEVMLEQARAFKATGKPPQAPSLSEASTAPSKNESEILAVAIKAIQLYAEAHPRPSQVTQEQAAEMVGVSPATISRMVKAGALRLNKFGRIPVSEIDKALAVK